MEADVFVVAIVSVYHVVSTFVIESYYCRKIPRTFFRKVIPESFIIERQISSRFEALLCQTKKK